MQRPKSNPLSPSIKNLFYFSWQIGLEGADMGLRELAAGQSWIIVLKPRIRYIYWSLEPYSSLSCACIMQIWQIGKDWRRSWVLNGAESDWGWRLIGDWLCATCRHAHKTKWQQQGTRGKVYRPPCRRRHTPWTMTKLLPQISVNTQTRISFMSQWCAHECNYIFQ